MRSGRRDIALEAVVWLAVCGVLWPLPLVNRLHVESAAWIASMAWFVTGWIASRRFVEGRSFGPELGRRVASTAWPVVFMTIPVIWAPNCAWVVGLGYLGMFVVPTIVLSTATAWWLSARGRPHRPAHFLIGAGVMLSGPLWDLGLHPQFFTYNHVFGGVLGPLYDEDIVWRWGFAAFRILTLVWAAFAWEAGRWRRGRRSAGRLAGIAIVLAAMYGLGDRLGIQTSRQTLERALPHTVEQDGLRLHADTVRTDARRLRLMADFASWQAHRLGKALGIAPSEPVDVWIYPDPDVRAALTGARVTSVAPVWLREPQVHVIDAQFEDLFPHELVHAWSREFGMPIIRASPAVGLVEGLAVALEPPDGRPSADELVAASLGDRDLAAVAGRTAEALTPWGFWSGRSGVSYTVTGSFVSWLLATKGAAFVRRTYRSGDLASTAGADPVRLVDEWMQGFRGLRSLPYDAHRRARARFSAPSLLEQRCPHYVPAPVRDLRRAEAAWARGDTAATARHMDRAMDSAPLDPSVAAFGAWLSMRLGDPAAAVRAVDLVPDSLRGATLRVIAADLAALGGDIETAAQAWDQVRRQLPVSSREPRALLVARAMSRHHPEILRQIVLGAQDDPTGLLRSVDSLRARQEHAPVSWGALGEWERQTLVWKSAEAERQGDLRRAWAFADSALAAFRGVGDTSGAAWMGERGLRLEWLETRMR